MVRISGISRRNGDHGRRVRTEGIDHPGPPADILSKIGEPYLKTVKDIDKEKIGLGLGLFIGKTLLEKNFAILTFRNSKTRGGAEVKIKWKNNDLLKL